MGYVRIKPRKWPFKQDEKARSNFKEKICNLKEQTQVDLWFCDETGFSGDPVPRRILCRKGERPRISYFGSHIKANVVGAVRVRDGKFISLLLPFVDSNTFQLFIYEMEKDIDKSRQNIVVLDNATWHKTKKLNWGILEPLYLPAYSPDLNPIEELWLVIKNQFFSWFWTNEEEKLDNHLIGALRYYIERPSIVKSICSMRTYD